METTKKQLDSICYKKNFLSEVIARVDLMSPIQALEKSFPSNISEKIKPIFPIPEPRKVIAFPLQVSSKREDVKNKIKSEEMMEWRFHGKEKEKLLSITPNTIFVQYKSYKTYEELRDEFLSILSLIFENYEDAQGQRLGLRYINTIKPKKGKIFDWSDYLNKNLLCSFQFYEKKGITSRVLHNIVFNFGNFNLKYQFGMHNPDFPALIKKKIFILDFDAYYQGLQDKDDIYKNLDKYHNKIQELFELSITDKLRDILNGK